MEERRLRAARAPARQEAPVPAPGRPGLGGLPVDGGDRVKPLGLGEHGGITVVREGSSHVAYVRYRDYSGRGRRLKRSGRSKAEASRNVLRAVREALGADGDGEFSPRSLLEDAASGWLATFEGLVNRGARSPSTLDEYRYVLARVVVPGVGSLRLGEISTPRLDRFV